MVEEPGLGCQRYPHNHWEDVKRPWARHLSLKLLQWSCVTLGSCNSQLSTVKLRAGRQHTFLVKFLWGDFMQNTIMVMQFCLFKVKIKNLNIWGPNDSAAQVKTSEVFMCPLGVCCGWLEGRWDLAAEGGFLWFCGGVGEPALFKLTVIQHPAKSQAHNSTTLSGYMAPAWVERATHTVRRKEAGRHKMVWTWWAT